MMTRYLWRIKLICRSVDQYLIPRLRGDQYLIPRLRGDQCLIPILRGDQYLIPRLRGDQYLIPRFIIQNFRSFQLNNAS